ncbi:MAG: glycosyltransferase family 39 protein [Chloroflexales bacterium]
MATLVALFLALCCVYNASVPLGEGPDEPGHLAYVLFLAREWHLPVQRGAPAESDVPGEGHQPPLAYLLAAPAVAWLPADHRQIVLTTNRKFIWAGGDQPAAFMRGSREYWPWQGSTLMWHIARAVSALCGAATVLCTYLAARTLWPGRRPAPLLAAALVALNPQFLFSCALVSNDPLLAACGAAILWRCLALAGSRATPTWFAFGVCGLLFGLALLTKQSALLLGPLLLWAGWRAARGSWPRLGGYTLAWALSAALVAGWWYLRNRQLYGDFFGAAMFSAEFAGQPFAWGDPAAWAGALGQLFSSFWARFGWMSVAPPAWAIWIYGVLVAGSMIGWLTHTLGAVRSGLAPLRKRTCLPAHVGGPLILLAMALAWILSFAATAGLVAWQGRMLFPAIGAIGILLAGGIQQGTGDREQGTARIYCLFPVACSLALALYMPLGVIAPAYTWAALPPAQAQASLGTPAYVRYAQNWERGVVLRGWRIAGPAAPGTDLPISLTWNSLEPVPRSWTVFIDLRDAGGQPVARSESRPQDAALPFTVWTPGDWVADQHRLALPADLMPGRYRLIVGLYRPEKNNIRLPVWAEDGSPVGDEADLGAVLVTLPPPSTGSSAPARR